MYADRKVLFEELEQKRNSKVISYITSDRPGLSTQIAEDAVDLFVHHLDQFNKHEKLTLFLYTRGGNALAAWRLVNLIRQFFDYFEVLISFKAHSAGTLISIGSNNIIMTKQATLGPIDPSINTPLNPTIINNNIPQMIPVSVEAIKGFIELSKNEFNIHSEEYQIKVLEELSKKVHPIVLGEAFRARSQIQMLAEKLLSNHIDDNNKMKKIIDFLTSESGSHDYTIHRNEAKKDLGLNIEKPDQELYNLIIKIHNNYADELDINKEFNPFEYFNGSNNFDMKSAFVESLTGGSHNFRNDFTLSLDQSGNSNIKVKKGWYHEQ